MPNPGKSVEEKKRVGSREPIKDSVLNIQPIKHVPEPIRQLDHAGLDLWNRAWVTKTTWLKDSDLHLLQLTCEQLDERDSLRAFVLENMEAWHERAALRLLEKEIQSNLIQLGFTPTARQKLGIQEVKAVSKLQELQDKWSDRG